MKFMKLAEGSFHKYHMKWPLVFKIHYIWEIQFRLFPEIQATAIKISQCDMFFLFGLFLFHCQLLKSAFWRPKK